MNKEELHKFIEENKEDIEESRRQYLIKQIKDLNLKPTANEKYFRSDNGIYYTLVKNNYLAQDNIIDVREDGSYLIKEKIKNSEYYLHKLITKDNNEIELQVIHPQTGPVQSITKTIKLLEMRKEVVNKYKRIGYSGASFDYIANIVNFFQAPEASGYYMCKNCYFWKWSFKTSTFKRNFRIGLTQGAPELADYEYKDKNTIIRTDYTGKGLLIAV